jgi:hypothetical protein
MPSDPWLARYNFECRFRDQDSRIALKNGRVVWRHFLNNHHSITKQLYISKKIKKWLTG